jgi:hypothetical protein
MGQLRLADEARSLASMIGQGFRLVMAGPSDHVRGHACSGHLDEDGTSSIVEEAPQNPRPARMLELAQRLCLDLADALSGHRELLADFFQRVVGVQPVSI